MKPFTKYALNIQVTFPNESLDIHQKAASVVKSTFRGFSYEHYLYSFLCRECKQLIYQQLHNYG